MNFCHENLKAEDNCVNLQRYETIIFKQIYVKQYLKVWTGLNQLKVVLNFLWKRHWQFAFRAGKMLFDQLSNCWFSQDTRLALRRDSFVMQCCERLLHQNKVAALSANQITCLLSIVGLNYRGRRCQLHARWTHMDWGRVRPQSLCLCIVCYRTATADTDSGVCNFTRGFEGIDCVRCFLTGSGGAVASRDLSQSLPIKAETFVSFWMGFEGSLDIENKYF